jgi:hypothetical protein
MPDLIYLPAWPLQIDRFAWMALLLMAAVLSGEILWRFLGLPRLLGWVAIGAAAGPFALGILDEAALSKARWFVNAAIGLVLFEFGQRVDLSWLKRNPWLLATSIVESTLAFAAMYAVLLLLSVPPLVAAIASAIGIATSPTVTLVLAKDLRAQGQVTERMLLLAALNCVYAFVLMNTLFAWLHSEYDGRAIMVIVHPLYLIFGSFALAALMAAWAHALFAGLPRRADAQYIAMVSLVVLSVSLADSLHLSLALTLLGFGAFARVFDSDRRFVSFEFGHLGTIFVVLLFALTAAELDWTLIGSGFLAGGALIAARYAGRTVALISFARPAGLPVRTASLLSLALMPMSGVALMLVRETSSVYPQFGPALAGVMLPAIAVMELLGPLVTQFALVKAGETENGK